MKAVIFFTLVLLNASLDSKVISTSPQTTHSEDEWKQLLGADRYKIMRKKGTERAFLGEYTYKEGSATYHCAACDLPLFDGMHQYDARSGYPSFTQPIEHANVFFEEDWSLPFKRFEVLCSGCHSHLGHIFKDGPAPKKLRYCINSLALKRVEN